MKVFESVKRWFNVKQNIARIHLNKKTDGIINENLIDLINDEIENGKQAFNDNCYRAAEFNVSVERFKEGLEKLKNTYDSYCKIYNDELFKLKNDETNEALRSKVGNILIKKNQIKDEITINEDAYKNLVNEQKKLEKCIRKQKTTISEQKARADLLIVKKNIIDMYKKMNVHTNPVFEKNMESYLDRLDNEIKINDELQAISEKISPEISIETEVEEDLINKMIDEDLKKLN